MLTPENLILMTYKAPGDPKNSRTSTRFVRMADYSRLTIAVIGYNSSLNIVRKWA